MTWFLDHKNNNKINTVWNWKFSNSLKVKGIVIRKDVNGIGVIIWIEKVNVERKRRENILTTTQQQSPIEVKFKKELWKRTTETVTIKMEVQVAKSVFGRSKHIKKERNAQQKRKYRKENEIIL